MNKPEFVISSEVGKKLLEWCNDGISLEDEVRKLIQSAKTTNELLGIYNQYPTCQNTLHKEFGTKKLSLELTNKLSVNPQKFSTNGTHTSQ